MIPKVHVRPPVPMFVAQCPAKFVPQGDDHYFYCQLTPDHEGPHEAFGGLQWDSTRENIVCTWDDGSHVHQLKPGESIPYPQVELSAWDVFRHRVNFWWTFSKLKFYWCLLIHRKYRWLPNGNIESACEKCYLQGDSPIQFHR